MKALARRPEDRFSSAAQFLAALLLAQTHAGGAGSSDETIIEPRPAVPAAVRELASQPPSTNTLVGSGWNMEVLTEVEKRLARFVGPIARVMVRRAAKETTDVVALTQLLAGRIIGTSEREAFLKGAGIATGPARTTPRPTSAQEPTSGRQSGVGTLSGSQRPLTPEDIARITQLLIPQVGPIATVLAKRAAKPGCSREQFIVALATCLKDDGARSRFLDSLD
jgi:serine/threonine-protein kinase